MSEMHNSVHKNITEWVPLLLLWGGGSVFVSSSFIVASIVCRSFVFGSSFVMQYLVPFIALQSSCREKENLLLYKIIIGNT